MHCFNTRWHVLKLNEATSLTSIHQVAGCQLVHQKYAASAKFKQRMTSLTSGVGIREH